MGFRSVEEGIYVENTGSLFTLCVIFSTFLHTVWLRALDFGCFFSQENKAKAKEEILFPRAANDG